MKMEYMTADEFALAVKNNPLIILPIGATEAHGSHLPLCTDTIQPEYIAEEISRVKTNVIVAPSLNFGLHSSTKNMPGTINLTFDTLRAVVYDILTSLYERGVKQFLLMSGHAGSGHMTALSEACKRVVSETDAKIMLFTDYDIAERCPDLPVMKGDGHGGCLETSRILAIRPDLVRESRPVGSYIYCNSVVQKDASVAMPAGVAGDTSGASAELGRTINGYIVETVIRMIDDEFRI